MKDIRYALRQFLNAPIFTATAVLTPRDRHRRDHCDFHARSRGSAEFPTGGQAQRALPRG